MSGLAGVRWLDHARHAAVADLRRPLETLAHRGPDGLFAHASGPCALGIAQFVSTPEARGERQPHVSQSGLVITLDGRVDNADDLRVLLGSAGRHPHTDAAVIAAAWEKWGAASLERILGDFALAVWSPLERRLWLARDVFGVRPLCYRLTARGFWWGSEVQTLARLGNARVNHGMVAEYLADSIRSETETLVDGVLRLPRASVLALDGNGTCRIVRYWTPSLDVPSARRRDDDVVEEFRGLFSQAVRARVRSDLPIAVTLSGGLDSSLVAAEAADMQQSGAGPAVRTFTIALPGHPADEFPYAEAVANHLHLPATMCRFGTASLAPIVEDAERALDMPQATNCVASSSVNDAIRAAGVRVCLNGVGGNEWFSGYHFAFADQLRRFQWLQMARRMRAFRTEDSAYTPFGDLRLALWLQLPEGAKHRLRRILGLPRIPDWIQPRFAARVALADRLRTVPSLPEFPSIQQRLMFAWSTNADKMFFTEYTERVNASVGCEERMPLLDRRLVEWALGLPDDQRRREGTTKVVLRRAAAGRLPEAIVKRERGPDFSFQTSDGLHQIGGWPLVRSIAGERKDWVDAAQVRRLWDEMILAEQTGRGRLGYTSWAIWLLVGTHLAARAIEQCRAPAFDAAWEPPATATTIASDPSALAKETVA
jgi:asparagine synthase (glutamine-hydrolysing)